MSFDLCEIFGANDWSEVYRGAVLDGVFGSSREQVSVARCAGCGIDRRAEEFATPELVYETEMYLKSLQQVLDSESYFQLPASLQAESFSLLKHSIYDDSTIDVYVNSARDFAFLAPRPAVDYRDYKPRYQTLGLSGYKKNLGVIESRFAKIHKVFVEATAALEVGAADSSFFAYLKMHHPDMLFAAIEPDESTQMARSVIAGIKQYATLDAAATAGLKVDIIFLFHVFEHLTDPASWLVAAKRLLAPGGQIVIEVPSLDDPLLSLYKSSTYRDFYFQKQYSFVCSAALLRRVLEHNGFAVEVMPYQRYGLENHLTRPVDGRPGGSVELRAIFSDCEADYRTALESRGLADSAFVIARVAT